LSADSIVPNWFNPQSLNRFAYCYNNPLICTDLSGHEPTYFQGIGGIDPLGWVSHYFHSAGNNVVQSTNDALTGAIPDVVGIEVKGSGVVGTDYSPIKGYCLKFDTNDLSIEEFEITTFTPSSIKLNSSGLDIGLGSVEFFAAWGEGPYDAQFNSFSGSETLLSGSVFFSPDYSWIGSSFGVTVFGLPGVAYEETYYNPISLFFGDGDRSVEEKVDAALDNFFSDIE
jgi:hypothetical protein